MRRQGEGEGRPARVLLVEDHRGVREQLRDMLSERYEVRAEAAARPALAAVRSWRPDLVLSDVRMPGLDGLGLVRALRSEDSTRGVPILLVSAHDGEDACVAGLEAGADDFVSKPFRPRELLARVNAHLELSRVRREAAELRAREAARREFVATVSHELRTPVAAIKGFTETLLNGGLGDARNRRQFVRIIDRNAQRLGQLVEDLLELSALERGRRPPEPQRVALRAFVDAFLQTMSGLAAKRRVAAENRVDPDLEAWADEAQLGQVLQNLVSNGIKYNRPGGKLRLAARREGPWVVLTVRDTGPGIPADRLPHIFEPFNRGHAAREAESTGLGLSIVKSIVEAHGGRISVESVEGEGTSFHVSMPAPPAEGRALDSASKSQPALGHNPVAA